MGFHGRAIGCDEAPPGAGAGDGGDGGGLGQVIRTDDMVHRTGVQCDRDFPLVMCSIDVGSFVEPVHANEDATVITARTRPSVPLTTLPRADLPINDEWPERPSATKRGIGMVTTTLS